jgi:hypothetical protein
VNLFSGYSQNQISINFLDFITQETDVAEIITNHQSPHPDTVKFEPEWYQNFVKQNILGSMIALFICYEADMKYVFYLMILKDFMEGEECSANFWKISK